MTTFESIFPPCGSLTTSYRPADELALTPSEKAQVTRAADLLDKEPNPSANVRQAGDILDKLTGEPEDPSEKSS